MVHCRCDPVFVRLICQIARGKREKFRFIISQGHPAVRLSINREVMNEYWIEV
jgi:hypothetical protein